MDDFLKELEYLGLIARLKRLSDTVLYSIRDLYKIYDLDIEPNWHVIFLLLKKHETCTMTEIADVLHLSQPAVVKIVNKMERKGYVERVIHQEDNRKRQLQLTQKALDALPKFERIWSAGQGVVRDIFSADEAFLARLQAAELALNEELFKNRVMHYLNATQ